MARKKEITSEKLKRTISLKTDIDKDEKEQFLNSYQLEDIENSLPKGVTAYILELWIDEDDEFKNYYQKIEQSKMRQLLSKSITKSNKIDDIKYILQNLGQALGFNNKENKETIVEIQITEDE